jgi:hypothetical protein
MNLGRLDHQDDIHQLWKAISDFFNPFLFIFLIKDNKFIAEF